jgi:predicted small integral membrane protein
MIRVSRGSIPRNCTPSTTSAFNLAFHQLIRDVCLLGGVAVLMASKLQAREFHKGRHLHDPILIRFEEQRLLS